MRPRRREDAKELAHSGRTRRDYECDFEEIEIGDELGKGASAKVYRGRYQEQEVAVKVMGGDEYDEEFKHELRIIIRLQHPNILK